MAREEALPVVAMTFSLCVLLLVPFSVSEELRLASTVE